MTHVARTDLRFGQALTHLLAEHDISATRLAHEIGVSQPFLSRVMRAADYKTPSANLMRRIADHFNLPADYWREAREAFVFEYLRAHTDELNRTHDRLRRRR